MAECPNLEQWIARQTGLSRRRVYDLYKAGQVLINGNPPKLLTQAFNPKKDTLHVKGEKLQSQAVSCVYYKFHKPSDVLTTLSDPRGRRTVADFINRLPTPVFPVGRLDRHSTGLLFLTNDGDWANQLMHPKFHISKTYAVSVDQPITKTHLARLSAGFILEDGPFRFLKVDCTDKTHLTVTIDEGRNRIIRRAFETLGYTVKKLKRLSIGSVQLGTLEEGKIRPLSPSELRGLRI